MNTKFEYDFFAELLVRSPFYSLDDYDLNRLPDILQSIDFRNALWLASPEFYRLIEKKDFAWSGLMEKERLSLQKYYNRMSFRSTPFGSFASFSLVKWSTDQQLRLENKSAAILHLLPSISQKAVIRHSLATPEALLRSNPLLYRLGIEWRYMKAMVDDKGKFNFTISAIDCNDTNDFLIGMCAKAGLKNTEIALSLVNRVACSREEAADYINFLQQEQVLIAPSGGLIEPIPNPLSVIHETIGDDLMMPFSSRLVNAGLLSRFDHPGEEKKGQLFYAGLERPAICGGASLTDQLEISGTISLLQRIVQQVPNQALKAFMSAFKAKFESQRVPLLQVMDPDAGIGYAKLHRAIQGNEELRDLNHTKPENDRQTLEWTAVHRLFLKLGLGNQAKAKYDPINISDEEILTLPEEKIELHPPPGISVLYTQTPENIIIDAAGGASTTALSGRFSVFNPEISSFCREMAAAESAANPGVVFAELHQHSHQHVDNINRRCRIYDHIIPLYAYPDDTEGHQILPDDLLVSVQGDHVLLESISLGKRVIPRLPTAYNYRHNDLPIFRFLCELQFQGLQADLSFHLERLFPGLDFYPRVVYKKCILSAARWYLSKEDVRFLRASDSPLGRLHIFRQERSIPQRISLGLNDQLLVFDLANDKEALFFLDCLKDQHLALIKEYILPDLSVTSEGKRLAGQFMVFMKKSGVTYSPMYASTPVFSAIRSFLPGSEWLYVKIYCTPQSADKILRDVVVKLLDKYDDRINCWFFIRYQDPEPHLRVRFRSVGSDATFLLNELGVLLAGVGNRELIRDYKTDTYVRELERYSDELIGQVEAYFCAGSNWILRSLFAELENGTDMDLKAVLLVFNMCGTFINDPWLLVTFFNLQQQRFMIEFDGGHALRIDLDSRYRTVSRQIKEMIEIDKTTGNEGVFLGEMESHVQFLADETISWHPVKRDAFLADLVHMQLNRLFISSQREHEMVVYYFCYKYMVSVTARLKEQLQD